MPDRPLEEHPEPAHEGEATRRDLLERALTAGACVWAAGVAIPAGMYLWPAGSSGPTRKYVELDPDSVPKGGGKVVAAGGKPVLVLHLPNGEFRAMSAVCTHLGCIVHWEESRGHVACPCHAGVFGADGSVVSGPPPRPLALYPCQIVDGKLRVTT